MFVIVRIKDKRKKESKKIVKKRSNSIFFTVNLIVILYRCHVIFFFSTAFEISQQRFRDFCGLIFFQLNNDKLMGCFTRNMDEGIKD